MLRSAVFTCVTLSLCTGSWAQEFEIDQARLDALRIEVLPELEKEFGELEHPVALRVATREEVVEALTKENQVLMRNQMPDEASAQRAATAFARSLAPIVLGKYAFGAREILIVPENLTHVSELLGMPGLASEGVLRAVVVHEFVHAFDDQRFDLDETYPSLTDADRVSAFNAVMEGHAQHVTRRISSRAGWIDGFQRYTAAIDAPVDVEQSAAEELARKVATAMLAAYYHEGERFFAAIEKGGGESAVARAFSDPPRDMATIYEPAWFLDPDSRPALIYDIESALSLAAEAFPQPPWKVQRLTLTKVQLQAALSVLPSEIAEASLRSLRNGRALTCVTADPEEGQVIAALLEFPSPAEASLFDEANRKALIVKDEVMKEGPVRIVEAAYRDVDQDGLEGVIARKELYVGGNEIQAVTLLAKFESLAIEVNYISRPVEDEDLITWCLAVLDRATPELAEAK